MNVGAGIGLLLMVCAAGAGLAMGAGAVIGSGRDRLARGLLGGLAGLTGLYLVVLAVVSGASQRRVLAAGKVKHFCGCYLDCHLGVSVDEVRTAETLASAGRAVVARGTFHVVTLRISSDAKRATLIPCGLLAVAVDEHGRRYQRARDAERALLGAVAERPLEQAVAAGACYARTLVFDLPADTPGPALSVSEHGFPDGWIEKLLIGDEDSFFHAPTLLSLAPTRAAGAAEPRPPGTRPSVRVAAGAG